MITTSGLGLAGFAVGTGFTAPSCGQKDLSGWVVTIPAYLNEIKPLLPDLGLSQVVIDKVSGWIDTAVSVAKKFDDAYQSGKFADAVTLFANLGGLITEIAAELNVTDNRIIKLALVGIQIARITIASLLQSQGDALPTSQKARAMGVVTGPQQTALSEIQRLASIDVNGLLKAVQ
jgi:hypothetical protein